jgi:hypothetical protein
MPGHHSNYGLHPSRDPPVCSVREKTRSSHESEESDLRFTSKTSNRRRTRCETRPSETRFHSQDTRNLGSDQLA